jgi:hypothetical protein
MGRSLQAQFRDPAWLLARQWQVGEFMGVDGGSPVQATISLERRPLTTYLPGPAPGASEIDDGTLPLEARVERTPVALQLRGAVQLGLRFEAMARVAGATVADLQQFRDHFVLPDAAPDELPDVGARAFRSIAKRRVTDGNQLYSALVQGQALPPAAVGLAGALADFRGWRDSLFTEPMGDASWDGRQLYHRFASASETDRDSVKIVAPEFRGDRLDWYSFDSSADVIPATGTPATPIEVTTHNFLPNHVTFHGMPNSRWWDFEDGQTDFGQLDAEHVDLAKMLVMEFALVFGNDWFELPVPVDAGSLSRVDTLVVTDTFGVATLIRPTESIPAGPRPWSMFKLSGGGGAAGWLLEPPSLGFVDEGPILEQVLFLRDEMAAMCWAVEQKLTGVREDSIDGYEAWRLRVAADPPPPPRQPQPGGPGIYYLLETSVPDNWIPMVPVQSPAGGLYFRRGMIDRPSSGGPVSVVARASILEPQHPYFVTDHTIPKAGANVTLRFRRTRWTNGSTVLWLARRTEVGRGPGWSGLAFDLIEAMGTSPPQIGP